MAEAELVQLRLLDRQIGALDLDVAAQQRRRIALQAGQHAGIDDADRGDRGDAERQAGEKDGEAAAKTKKPAANTVSSAGIENLFFILSPSVLKF